MKINFNMWGKAISALQKIEKKEDWDALDPVSKWLIATRSAVTSVTLYSCAIAGLLAWRDQYFSFLPWLIVTAGLFIAHGTNNLLNDYTDFSRGVDTDNYFRTQYGVHPLVQGFWTKPQQLRWFFASGVLAFLSGVFALFYTGFSPAVIGLFAFGALVLLFYTWPLKYLGLGELCIFLIWGPILAAGVYIVLARGFADNVWYVALAGVPLGLSIVSINIGKHIDKLDEDKRKGGRHLACPHRGKGCPLSEYHHSYSDLWGDPLHGLWIAVFYARIAFGLFCRETIDVRRGGIDQTAACRTAQGMAGLANLVFRLCFLPQPFV